MADNIDNLIDQVFDTNVSVDEFASDTSQEIDSLSSIDKKRLSLEERNERKRKRLGINQDKDFGQDSDTILNIKSGYNFINDLWDGEDVTANIDGKRVNTGNKIFEDADTTMDQSIQNRENLIQEYTNATNDPNAKHKVYQLRLNDGYDENGNPLYVYKTGIAKTSASERYKNQLVKNGYEILSEKGFAGAKEWEYKWHGNKANLSDRTSGRKQDLTGANEFETIRDIAPLGSGGSSEVYNTQFFNKDITDEQIKANQAESDKLALERSIRRSQNPGSSDSIVDAFQAGTVGALADTGDFILDVLTPGDNTLLNEAKKRENIDKFVGYNRENANKAIGEATGLWKQGNYVDSIWTVFTEPQIVAESIPMMIEMVAGFGKFTKAGKLANSLSKAEKVGDVAKINKYKKAMSETVTAGNNVMYQVAKNAGFLATVGGQTNNQLEERKANNNGKEPEMDEVAGVFGSNMLLLGLDRIAFGKITGIEGGKVAFKNAFGVAPLEGKKRLLAGLGNVAAGLATAGAAEGAQEFIQSWGEILNEQLGTEKGGDFEKIISSQENIDRALGGAIAGAAGGAQIRGAVDVATGIPNAAKTTVTAFREIQENRKSENNAIQLGIEGLASDEGDRLTGVIASNEKDIESKQKYLDEIDVAETAKQVRERGDARAFVSGVATELDFGNSNNSGLSVSLAEDLKNGKGQATSEMITQIVSSLAKSSSTKEAVEAFGADIFEQNLDEQGKPNGKLKLNDEGLPVVDPNADTRAIANAISHSISYSLNSLRVDDIDTVIEAFDLDVSNSQETLAKFKDNEQSYASVLKSSFEKDTERFKANVETRRKTKAQLDKAGKKQEPAGDVDSLAKEASDAQTFLDKRFVKGQIKKFTSAQIKQFSKKFNEFAKDSTADDKTLASIRRVISDEYKKRVGARQTLDANKKHLPDAENAFVNYSIEAFKPENLKETLADFDNNPEQKKQIVTAIRSAARRSKLSKDESDRITQAIDALGDNDILTPTARKNLKKLVSRAEISEKEKVPEKDENISEAEVDGKPKDEKKKSTDDKPAQIESKTDYFKEGKSLPLDSDAAKAKAIKRADEIRVEFGEKAQKEFLSGVDQSLKQIEQEKAKTEISEEKKTENYTGHNQEVKYEAEAVNAGADVKAISDDKKGIIQTIAFTVKNADDLCK